MSNNVANTPEARLESLASSLKEHFSAEGYEVIEHLSEVTLVVPRDQFRTVMQLLKSTPQFSFEEMIDICGIDYLSYGQEEWQTKGAPNSGYGRGVESPAAADADAENRFASVYHLLSITNNVRLRVRVMLNTACPEIDSVNDLWPASNWFEREAFDLYGILYSGHPDLRRILTDYGFIGHPFRKDFPLEGYVEMRYDEEKKRVIYEPVDIEPRTLVPKVIRNDGSQLPDNQDKQDSADA
ncbi:MAG: NADH-quinone oxidoreductase subunit C [Candidatus Polarisedimenticolaceae bacterium]|nr:NADH-quinone oxidoreductase subunit C [Candidatus Polarisedimenticolaceae bacterium]